jgi:hypothetical protein
VDAEWRQEVRAYNEKSADLYRVQSTSRGKMCKVYATQYIGYSRSEGALPHRELKFDGGYRVRIRRGGHRIGAPVREVGPWNTYDNYWQISRYRTMWKDLPRCKPEAEAAYFNNYNHGEDEPRRGGPDAGRRPQAGTREVPERLGTRALPVGAPVGLHGAGFPHP